MDYTIISITTTAVLASAGFIFLFISKVKTNKEIKSNQSSNENSKSIKKKLSDNINKLLSEKLVMEKLLKEKERQLSDFEKVKQSGAKFETDEKLIKEINDLKEKIEDLEDEISDLEKRNKRLKEEKNELEEKIYSIEKGKNELEDTLQKNENKLNEAEKVNKRQQETLSFISDILNANNAKNEKYEEINNKTWEIFSYINDNLKNGLSYLENDFINDDTIDECWNWCNQEVKTWIKNKKVVAIVGEFSAGKTTIVNRILKQDDPNAIELPVKSTETTAIPTYISKGIDFNCQFYSPSGDLKNISSESFQKVTKSVLDDINISSLVKYFVLSYKNENLSNLSILDTPGFGSNSEEIINKTTKVVKEADALFWVVDANSGELNSSSVKVIKDNLQDIPLYLIINKSDTKSPKDLKILESKIKETLDKNKINYKKVITFSHVKELDELMTILNSISPKNQRNIISEIREQINITLKDSKALLGELKREEKSLRRGIEVVKRKLNDIINEIDYSLDDMQSVIEFKEKFFVEDYYKITKDKYGKFENGKERILSSNDRLPDSINNFIDLNGSHSEMLEKISNKKYFIDNLKDSNKKFEDLINNYNPKLIS
ncbi:small GTP-binding protein domain-containing protein [Lutibacter agarilyticus]|uniref:Small GTP-binding protein domain-containing protein n=1 Tax=Lutibacter agarilyticus TaxID=1109740 RepID=A0A238WXW5_9FLAO|nr:dynamin family protein [Lutibacter agarilyticus]SNR51044.1 small GTP-binding protein domain-containing protein [Lutibacter agarilyticus]